MVPPKDSFDAPENHFLRRAKNHQVRRSRRKRHLLVSILLGTIRGVVLGGILLGTVSLWQRASTSPRYALRKIQLVGLRRASRPEVQARLARFRGTNLFVLSLGDMVEAAKSHPWIKDASVRRVLPDAVEVDVREREPFVLARVDGRIVLVDDEGAILGAAVDGGGGPPPDLPVLTGIDDDGRNDTVARRASQLQRGIGALAGVGRVAPELLAAISEVNLGEETTVRMVLRSPARTLWLSDAHVEDELLKYFRVKDALGARAPGFHHVDLRFEKRVVVRSGDGEG